MRSQPININRFQQRGLAMVEMAIILPLLLLLILATAEFGRALFQYNTLTKTVRDGARYLANHAILGSTGVVVITTQLEQETRNLVVYGTAGGGGDPLVPGLTPADVAVTNPAGNDVTVSATYAYTPLFGPILPTFGLGGPISSLLSLRATVTMRAL